MKKTFLFIFCFFVLLANANGSDWQTIGSNDYGTQFVDMESVVYQNNIVKFWTKMVFSTEQYMSSIEEIDCIKKNYRILRCELYKKDEIVPTKCSTFDWTFIPPDTFTQSFSKKICSEIKDNQ